ncbi:MAG: hypothetical protein Q9216_005042 [Gyalolechia sp. 2 TL-2023]
MSVGGADGRWRQLLDDICLLASGNQPNAIHGSSLNAAFGLELIESSLAIHLDTVSRHVEQIYVLRNRLMPLIIQTLSERASFSLTVRSIRLLHLLASRLLSSMTLELEVAIDLVNHMLDPKVSPEWKRALCLEFFGELHGDPKLLRTIYAQYDEQDGRKNLVSDHLAILVRLAAEKPAVIGLGQHISEAESQYSLPAEQIAVESGGITGTIATSSFETSMDKPGLNVQWSTVRTPCMDLVDKPEAPALPTTYIYVLVLSCMSRFSEGLARFLLPFTVATDSTSKRKRASASNRHSQQNIESRDDEESTATINSGQSTAESPRPGSNLPVNPLELKDHEQYGQICTSASMVDHCWPALLATSSTFLNASLDSEYLHMLIRSFQKFTQVAGLLDLATPKDAFLTTLAKHAVPTPAGDPSRTPTLGSQENSEIGDEEDHIESETDASPARGASSGNSRGAKLRLTSMTTRNLLCLRALLNLGIALGPVLRGSWTIILETLHQADCLLFISDWHDMKRPRAQPEGTFDDHALSTEKDAVETAVSRLFQSTGDLSEQAYLEILDCFSVLVYSISGLTSRHDRGGHATASGMLSPQAGTPRHQRFPSLHGLNVNKSVAAKDCTRVLDRIGQIAQHNIHRLCRVQSPGSGWSIFVNVFIDHLSSASMTADVRIGAARKLNALFDRLVASVSGADIEVQNEITTRCLDALAKMISSVRKSNATKSSSNCSLEIHAMGLETLTSILEQRGQILHSGWEVVFAIVTSAVNDTEQRAAKSAEKMLSQETFMLQSPRLVRLAFASLQLICSDFLTVVPDRHFPTLLDTLSSFCSQDQDFNISLTVIAQSMTFFRNLSDFLQLENENFYRKLETENHLNEPVDVQDRRPSHPNVWISLLLHLAQLIADDRVEVRHSALHTMFGIVDTCGDRLDTQAWMLCFEVVFLKLLSAIESKLRQNTGSQGNEDSSWDDTAVLLVQRLSKIIMQALVTISVHPTFSNLWTRYLAKYAELLGHGSLGLGRAVFTALAEILATGERNGISQTLSLDSAWTIWREHNPSEYALRGATSNHDAQVAYLQYIHQLHGLLDERFDIDQVEAILSNLRICVTQSTPATYGSDLDEMTAVQKLVLENMKLIPTSPPENLIKLAEEFAFLVTLAFQARENQTVKGKTYVALSKATMAVLEGFVKQHCLDPNISVAQLLSLSLHALESPLSLKYKWHQEGKGIPTWKTATSTALSLCKSDLLDRCEDSDSSTQSMWAAIVGISDSIVAADTDECESMTVITDDQAFDIESFSQLATTIIPTLGSVSIPDTIRRKYAESMFQHSIIHEPHPDDLARPDQELLEGLRSQHVGRVQDLPPKLRSKMAYVLLDQLFDLVAVHDSSTERVKLAQAAAPYLILRAGLVLKAYVCDQPLRGRMPQPLSQKTEMHHVLKKLVDLDSEPKAFPETVGSQSESKKHLFLLFGLVTKALKAARRDEVMSAALRRVLDAVGADFGV